MKNQTAVDLSNTLFDLESARENLENAPEAEKVAAADEYMRVRAASSPVFAQAQGEYDLAQAGASTPGTPPAAPDADAGAELPVEAAPGVPLVAPPAHVIDPENLERYGPLVQYWSKTDPTAPPIEATPYAFAEGTAVKTGDGEVGTVEYSRIVRSEAPVLAVVTQAEFDAAFTAEDPNAGAPPAETPSEPAADAGESAPAETPVSGEFERAPDAPAETETPAPSDSEA